MSVTTDWLGQRPHNTAFLDDIDDQIYASSQADRIWAAGRDAKIASTKARLTNLPELVTMFNLWVSGQQLYTSDGDLIDKPIGTPAVTGLADNALDDLDAAFEIDTLASECLVGSAAKSMLAKALNATTFESYQGHIQQRKDWTSYRRATITHDDWIGDSLQRDNGTMITVAVNVDGQAVLVEASKLFLDMRSPRGRAIWKLTKGTQTMRPGAWIYEPQRFIELGEAATLGAFDAETAAYRWHREVLDQREADGRRVPGGFEFEAKPILPPVRTRPMTPAQATRVVSAMSEESRSAILAALV